MDRQQSLLSRLNPRRKESGNVPATPPDVQVPDEGSASRTMCSSEIFSLFKSMAAGKTSRRGNSPARSGSSTPSAPPSTETLLADEEPHLTSNIESSSINSPGRDTPTSDDTPVLEPTEAEKLAAMQEEYGQIASSMVDEHGDSQHEAMLAESWGTMFKGLMVVGNIHLTSHRLLFHALLPPDAAFVHHYDSAEELEALGSSPSSSTHILHSGPVTWHRHKPLLSSQRVWLEMNADMITIYPSADDSGRVRPIKSFLLSSVDTIRPRDDTKASDIHLNFTLEGSHKSLFFTVDTPQSAAQWRRHIEAALFRIFRRRWRHKATSVAGKEPESSVDQWNTLRFCVPLHRLALIDEGDYHGFATLLSLKVDLDESQRLVSAGTFFAAADTASITDNLLNMHLRAKSDTDLTFNFNLAVITEQGSFIDKLRHGIQVAHLRHPKADVDANRLIFNIAGIDCLASEDDIEREVQEESRPSESLPARIARKAEKAHTAAAVFGLHEEEGIWLKRCYLDIVGVPVRGHLIVTPRFVCFWRKNTLSPDVKYRFDSTLVKGFEPVNCVQPGFSGLALKLHGQQDVVFEFWNVLGRDEAISQLKQFTTPETRPTSSSTTPQPSTPTHPADILVPSKKSLFETRVLPDDFLSHMPFIANEPWVSRSIALSPRTFTMLTIGSRGDVQPYIALGLRLKKDGHRVVIVTHQEFKEWVEGYGIEHRQAGGDPTALMKLSAEHKMLSPGFFKESVGYFRQWLDDLLVDAWEACKDADVLIESPSAMAGIHIAERLQIPYFRAFTMPWTRTSAYPQAFMVPAFEMGPGFNYSTYVLYDNIIWKATAGQINRWRKEHLGLPSTDMSEMSATKVPFLYNFSSAIVPKPLDWHDDITITGYWVLENSDSEWSPPEALTAFMDKAKADGKPLVYIGFGSIVVPKPNEITKSIIEAVEKADVRAIVAKGWSSRGGDPAKEGAAIEFPASCFGLEKVPHGWLFPKVQAALHHGGAGTVGASLRAGIPTCIRPFFGDQYFWANRVTKLGVGVRVGSLRSDDIAHALVKATTDRVMLEKAARIGEAIRKESGVDNALEAIQYNILRAGSDRTKMSWAK